MKSAACELQEAAIRMFLFKMHALCCTRCFWLCFVSFKSICTHSQGRDWCHKRMEGWMDDGWKKREHTGLFHGLKDHYKAYEIKTSLRWMPKKYIRNQDWGSKSSLQTFKQAQNTLFSSMCCVQRQREGPQLVRSHWFVMFHPKTQIIPHNVL